MTSSTKTCPIRQSNCRKNCEWYIKELEKCSVLHTAENINRPYYTSYSIIPTEKEDTDDGK